MFITNSRRKPDTSWLHFPTLLTWALTVSRRSHPCNKNVISTSISEKNNIFMDVIRFNDVINGDIKNTAQPLVLVLLIDL